MITMSYAYLLIVSINQLLSKATNVQFSKLEKTAIGLSILAGIDATVTPTLTGGQSLHQYLGIDTQQQTEIVLRGSELVVAYVGIAYQIHLGQKPSK